MARCLCDNGKLRYAYRANVSARTLQASRQKRLQRVRASVADTRDAIRNVARQSHAELLSFKAEVRAAGSHTACVHSVARGVEAHPRNDARLQLESKLQGVQWRASQAVSAVGQRAQSSAAESTRSALAQQAVSLPDHAQCQAAAERHQQPVTVSPRMLAQADLRRQFDDELARKLDSARKDARQEQKEMQQQLGAATDTLRVRVRRGGVVSRAPRSLVLCSPPLLTLCADFAHQAAERRSEELADQIRTLQARHDALQAECEGLSAQLSAERAQVLNLSAGASEVRDYAASINEGRALASVARGCDSWFTRSLPARCGCCSQLGASSSKSSPQCSGISQRSWRC